jgi:hypothetical protein
MNPSHRAVVHGSVCCPMHSHWKTPLWYNYTEKYMQTLRKIYYKIYRIIKTKGLLIPRQRGRLEWLSWHCLPPSDWFQIIYNIHETIAGLSPT